LLPVIDYSIQYKKPAYYDDEILVVTLLRQRPTGFRLPFDYECYNADGQLLNTGKVTLVCVDKSTGRPCPLPEWFNRAFDPFFER